MEPQDFSFSARSPWSICRILELDETEDDALNQMRPINFAATWHCSNAFSFQNDDPFKSFQSISFETERSIRALARY